MSCGSVRFTAGDTQILDVLWWHRYGCISLRSSQQPMLARPAWAPASIRNGCSISWQHGTSTESLLRWPTTGYEVGSVEEAVSRTAYAQESQIKLIFGRLGTPTHKPYLFN